MKRRLFVLCFLAALPGCNWTSQLDRDAGFCIVLAKAAGAACSVTIPPSPTVP